MLRFGFLAKKLSRSFLEISSKDIKPYALVDMKFASTKDLNLFIKDIDISKTSIPKLARSLKITKDNQQEKLHVETIRKLYQISDKVVGNLDKLDPQSIVDFCEGIGKFNMLYEYILPKGYKKELILRINEFLSTHSFDRRQILTIYENLVPKGYKIEELKYEVNKIVDNKSALKLEEISQIIAGSDRLIYSQKSDFFYDCMDRIFELSNQGELDENYLVKILDPLSNKAEKWAFKLNLEKFAKIIEPTLPRWKENDLLSIIKLYKNNNDIDKSLLNQALKQTDKFLSNEQPIEFVIKLISLLKEERKWKNAKEILLKSREIINSKMSEKFVGVGNLINILDLMKPIVDYRTAHLLKDQIDNKDSYFNEKLNLFQKASWICVNNEGKLFSLTDIISLDCKYVQNMKILSKLHIIYSITNTKNHNQFHEYNNIKQKIIDDLKISIDLSNENAKVFSLFLDEKNYRSEFVKALKPLQDIFYNSLEKQIESKYCLYYSMILYECDSKKWENFVKRNKFSHEAILYAIRFHKGPFEAIFYLLNAYEHNLSTQWISAAMQRIIEIQDSNILNNFARILNTMDPHFLLNDHSIYSRDDCFNHLLEHSDFTLLADLFSKAQVLLKGWSIDALFGNNNIKILSYAASLGNLDSDLADQVISNYVLMKNTDRWSILTISSKCSDIKLRERVIKNIINDKLEPHFIKIAIDRYRFHPKNKDIDNYIIGVLSNSILRSGSNTIVAMNKVLRDSFELMKNNHPELLNAMLSLTKDAILKNSRPLQFEDFDDLRQLFIKNDDTDFAKIIWMKLLKIIYYKNAKISQERITEKSSIGFPEKETSTIYVKDDSFNSRRLAWSMSFLADLSLEKEERANEVAQNLINYTENNNIVFENDLEYTDWLYGLIRFNANKSIIMRHLENSKYFEIEKPIFKHFLLANHFSMDPDYKGVNILEQKTDKYWRDFNYFKYFGIDKSLISDIQSKFNKENIEVKSGEFIDGIWVPFYIPHRKLALWPETNNILLYQSNIFNGEFAMHQKQLRRKLEDLVILNKSEINKGIEKIDIKKLLNI